MEDVLALIADDFSPFPPNFDINPTHEPAFHQMTATKYQAG